MTQTRIVVAVFTHVKHSLGLLLGEVAVLGVDIVVLRALTTTWSLFAIINWRNVTCRALSTNSNWVISVH